MKIIKLDAIDSTNEFLKALSQKEKLENFTVVLAKTQTKGKGQMGSKWISESDKNLTVSILIKKSASNLDFIFNLNIAIAVSVIQVLEKEKIPQLNIKWPNDIMAENKKIGGILIENRIKKDGYINSIVGIGLNINQTDFKDLPKASSLKNITNQNYDIEAILVKIVEQIKENIEKIKNKKEACLWSIYNGFLFKKGKPTLYEDANQERFMGIIQGVSKNGKLELQLEDDLIKQYGLKEIIMIY